MALAAVPSPGVVIVVALTALAAVPAEAGILLGIVSVGPADLEAGLLLCGFVLLDELLGVLADVAVPEVVLCVLGEFLLLEGESVHLHVLVAGHLVAQAFDQLFGGELLDLVGTGCAGNVVDVGGLEELPEDELSSPVAVHEGGGDPLLGEVLHGLGDVGSLDGDGVLDACPEEVEDIGPALDDDDRFGILHIGSGGAALLSVGGDLLDLQGFPDVLSEVGTASLGLVHEDAEELLGTLCNLLPLGDADILDADDFDGCLAGTDAVDGLEGGRDDSGLHLVERGGHVENTLGLSSLGDDLHLDPANPSGFLQVPEVEVVAEQTFGLSENGTHDIGFVHDSVCVYLCFNLIFD